MSSTDPARSAPCAGAEEPLQRLSTCHAGIQHGCARLVGLVEHLARRGSDREARAEAAELILYFDAAPRQHHADEEVDLFPALIESMAGSDAVCLRQLTEHLAAEHRELDARWRRVRAALQRVVEGERVSIEPGEVEALAGLHQRHIEREERELLPMAARLLGDDDLERLGRAMRERRGIASA
jgi:hemerythrin-like domain-containing protein